MYRNKFSAEARQAFVETYSALKQQAGADEPVLFIDGVHPTQGARLAYGWMPAGKKAHVVETTESRTRLNLMRTLNLNDMGKTVVREYDKINSHNITRFFIAIHETYPIKQKVHIILDGAGYHRTGQVKTWAWLLNIELHYLPPYSPNLNPIERLWKVMNEQVRNNGHLDPVQNYVQGLQGSTTATSPRQTCSVRKYIASSGVPFPHLPVSPSFHFLLTFPPTVLNITPLVST